MKNPPIEIDIDQSVIDKEIAAQNELRKRFDKAVKGKDLSDPAQGIAAIFEMFNSKK